MKIHDISLRIDSEAPVFPGDPPPESASVASFANGDGCSVQALQNWTTHMLTHVDMPAHFVQGGATLDDAELDAFVGPAQVVRVTGSQIGADAVPDRLAASRVIFRTDNSARPVAELTDDPVSLSLPAAERLIQQGVRLVGIDGPSVDRLDSSECPVHQRLLGAGVLILEGARLDAVEPGMYELLALPLRIAQGDGSPVRAVLVSREAS